MNWLHGVNKLYDGTLNKIHHLLYSTDVTTYEILTFRESTKTKEHTLICGHNGKVNP